MSSLTFQGMSLCLRRVQEAFAEVFTQNIFLLNTLLYSVLQVYV